MRLENKRKRRSCRIILVDNFVVKYFHVTTNEALVIKLFCDVEQNFVFSTIKGSLQHFMSTQVPVFFPLLPNFAQIIIHAVNSSLRTVVLPLLSYYGV